MVSCYLTSDIPCPNSSQEEGVAVTDFKMSENLGDYSPTLYAFRLAMDVVLTSIGSLFGIVTNIINLMVFKRIGLSDSSNIALFGLAFSDLLMQINFLTTSIVLHQGIFKLQQRMTFAVHISLWVHTILSRITGWITAFISIERCLCVALPLKIRIIFSLKRTRVLIVCTFIVSSLLVLPVFLLTRPHVLLSFEYNMTEIRIVSPMDHENMFWNLVIAFNNVVFPLITFIVVTTCTIILTIQLRRLSTKRQLMTNAGQMDAHQHRDLKLMKMVILVAAVYILCYTPNIAMYIGSRIILEFDAELRSPFWVFDEYFTSIVLLLEMLNSSVNIFIYLEISTKYRNTFRQLFCKCGK